MMEECVMKGQLGIDDLVEISQRKYSIRIDPARYQLLEEMYRQASVIAGKSEVYGRSTGVGANRHTRTTADPYTHGRNLLRSHAVDAGESVSHDVVRALMAIRLNQILQGGSGINPVIAEMVVQMLNADAIPDLKMVGSVGTADLAALAGIGLAMLGERPVSAPLEPLSDIGADSALPLMSSSALTIARSALLIHRLESLILAQEHVFLLSAVGTHAQPDAFSMDAAQAIPSDTVRVVAQRLSELRAGSRWKALRIQDPYAFRTFLGTHDVVVGAVLRLKERVEKLMNIAQENPLFIPGSEKVIHHGAFHQAHLAHELDATAIALGQSAPLAVSRIKFLNDDAMTGLPRFLAPEAGGSSGTMIVEYVAASALGDILGATAPAGVYSTVLSCGLEDDASFATTAANKLERAVEATEILVAAELVVAARAVRSLPVEELTLDGPLKHTWHTVESTLSPEMADRDLRGDLESARTLIGVLGCKSPTSSHS